VLSSQMSILPSLMQETIGSITDGILGYSIPFVEVLISLVMVLVSSSTGCAALREARLIPTLLPVFKDMDPEHIRLVSAAMHILEAFMEYSKPAGTWFRDLGGLNDTVARLKLEEAHAEEGSQLYRAEVQANTKGKAPLLEEDMALQQPSAGGQSDTLIP
jgi:hypothetical protein